ncbi:MAG: hypothetical protein MI924_11025 [Chloroflexales bacterium]|nr:hypothetical protein [Chloroflexales bacterium]
MVQHPLHNPFRVVTKKRRTGGMPELMVTVIGGGQVVGQRRNCSAGIPSANAARTIPPNNVVRRIPPFAALDGIKLSSVCPTSRDVRGRSRAAALAPRGPGIPHQARRRTPHRPGWWRDAVRCRPPRSTAATAARLKGRRTFRAALRGRSRCGRDTSYRV